MPKEIYGQLSLKLLTSILGSSLSLSQRLNNCYKYLSVWDGGLGTI